MKIKLLLLTFFPFFLSAQMKQTIFVEAESFTLKGGWVVDQQFMDVMGSSFLMAHGMGIPVNDASTLVKFPQKGKYKVYVRTRNWSDQWSKKEAAGQFQIAINDQLLPKILGKDHPNWAWTPCGEVEIESMEVKVSSFLRFLFR